MAGASRIVTTTAFAPNTSSSKGVVFGQRKEAPEPARRSSPWSPPAWVAPSLADAGPTGTTAHLRGSSATSGPAGRVARDTRRVAHFKAGSHRPPDITCYYLRPPRWRAGGSFLPHIERPAYAVELLQLVVSGHRSLSPGAERKSAQPTACPWLLGAGRSGRERLGPGITNPAAGR
jgi:hypothetical protein